MRADQLCFAVTWNQAWVNRLRSGSWIERFEYSLQPHVDGKGVFASVGLDSIVDRNLTGSDCQLLHLTVNGQPDQCALEGPVVIPLIVGHVLEIPGEFARIGIECDRGVTV